MKALLLPCKEGLPFGFVEGKHASPHSPLQNSTNFLSPISCVKCLKIKELCIALKDTQIQLCSEDIYYCQNRYTNTQNRLAFFTTMNVAPLCNDSANKQAQ